MVHIRYTNDAFPSWRFVAWYFDGYKFTMTFDLAEFEQNFTCTKLVAEITHPPSDGLQAAPKPQTKAKQLSARRAGRE